MNFLIRFLIVLSISPLWPLGPNPLPGDPFVIVNKSTNQVAFIDNGKIQEILPVGTGVTAELTPEGLFTITVKAIHPYYRKKDIPGNSPENPLGTRWIGFDALGTDGRTYGLHGTNQPDSVGKYVSQGCIRLKNEEIEQLFENIPLGTKVYITQSEKDFETLAKEKGAIAR